MSNPELPDKQLSDLDQIPAEILSHAEDVCAELEALCQRALTAAGLPASREPNESMVFTWTQGMSPELLAETIIEQARISASETATIQNGRVFCYHCKSCTCEHAEPPDAGQVFMGYGNNGRPIWLEFFNALNSLEDDRLDQLFEDRAKPVARLMGRKRLIANQFVGGGRNSMTYRIIAQVIAGYFRIQGQRCAVTFQVVENTKRELHLQFIAPDLVREVFADPPGKSHSSFYRIYDATQELRHKLRELGPEWRNCEGNAARKKTQDKVFSQLRHLMHIIERKGRQAHRRTKHAQQRSNDNRPVHKAIDDVNAAPREDFYVDRARQSIIVVGKKGRAHVFSQEGRHITTLNLPADKLERRVQRNRYAPMPAEDIDSFRAAVRE